jgi:hypothetical protein
MVKQILVTAEQPILAMLEMEIMVEILKNREMEMEEILKAEMDLVLM